MSNRSEGLKTIFKAYASMGLGVGGVAWGLCDLPLPSDPGFVPSAAQAFCGAVVFLGGMAERVRAADLLNRREDDDSPLDNSVVKDIPFAWLWGYPSRGMREQETRSAQQGDSNHADGPSL